MLIPSQRIRIIACGVLLAAAPLTLAQAEPPAEPGKVVVTIMQTAPGKQLDLLKWLAAREAVDKEAGVPATQIYAHVDGDSWDFLSVGPQLSEADNNKVEEIAKKHGLKTGFASGLEIRQFLATHTDTFARGPMSAADLVKLAGGK